MLNPKIVTASEAKNKLGAIIGWVLKNGNEVVVENHGQPKVVMMSYEQYKKINEIKEEVETQEMLERLRSTQKRISARNRSLTQKQADALANRFSREFVDDMVKTGKIKFKK